MKTVVVTPAGRRRYLNVLKNYLIDNSFVDEWRLWVNTTDSDDIEWMEQLAKKFPKVSLHYPSWGVNGSLTIHRYFSNCTDPDSVYVRLDDDIVWMSKQAIELLVDYRLKNPHPFLVYGNIFNTAFTSKIHQSKGLLTSAYGKVGNHCMDSVGWGSNPFARAAHYNFLNNHKDPSRWFMENRILQNFERQSINVISWTGRDGRSWCDRVEADEEAWLAHDKPKEINRPNAIAGDALFVHYAFYSQRDELDQCPLILESYEKLSKGEEIDCNLFSREEINVLDSVKCLLHPDRSTHEPGARPLRSLLKK